MEIADATNLSAMSIRDASNWHRIFPRKGIQWGDMKRWLLENTTGDYYWQPEGIRIKNKADAMMFKLKFGQINDNNKSYYS